eukprot:gene1232-1810_t
MSSSAPKQHIEGIRAQMVESKGMRFHRDVQNSCQFIGQELGGDTTQFLMELTQNAEDNHYGGAGAQPTLELQLLAEDPTKHPGCTGAVLTYNNERGFRREDIESICHIGESSKKNVVRQWDAHEGGRGYIGEKGIGFKSVFKISPCPHIFSRNNDGAYDFKFHKDPDEEVGVGFVVPKWVDVVPKQVQLVLQPDVDSKTRKKTNREKGKGSTKGKETGTAILLPLEDGKFPIVESRLKSTPPEFILFLRKLKALKVTTQHSRALAGGGARATVLVDVEQHPDLHTKEICTLVHKSLQNKKSATTRFWKGQITFEVPETIQEEKRTYSRATVEIAFALDQDTKGLCCDLYAYLPTKQRTGLPFLVNADFILDSRRESLKNDCGWNDWLLEDCTSQAFVETFEAMLAAPGYRSHALGFLPVEKLQGEYARFDCIVLESWELARQMRCVLNIASELVKPEDALVYSKDFMDLLEAVSASPSRTSRDPPADEAAQSRSTAVTLELHSSKARGASTKSDHLAQMMEEMESKLQKIVPSLVSGEWQVAYPVQLRRVLRVPECTSMGMKLLTALGPEGLSPEQLCEVYGYLNENNTKVDSLPLVRLQGRSKLWSWNNVATCGVFFKEDFTSELPPIPEVKDSIFFLDEELEACVQKHPAARAYLVRQGIRPMQLSNLCTALKKKLQGDFNGPGKRQGCVASCVDLLWWYWVKMPENNGRQIDRQMIPIILKAPCGVYTMMRPADKKTILLLPKESWKHPELYDLLDMESQYMLAPEYISQGPQDAKALLRVLLGAIDGRAYIPEQYSLDAHLVLKTAAKKCLDRLRDLLLNEDSSVAVIKAQVATMSLEKEDFLKMAETVYGRRAAGPVEDDIRFLQFLQEEYRNFMEVAMIEAHESLSRLGTEKKKKMNVTGIYDFRSHPGFTFLYGSVPKSNEEMQIFVDWLSHSLRRKPNDWLHGTASLTMTNTLKKSPRSMTFETVASHALRGGAWMPTTCYKDSVPPAATLPPPPDASVKTKHIWIRDIKVPKNVAEKLALPLNWSADSGLCQYLKALRWSNVEPTFDHMVELYALMRDALAKAKHRGEATLKAEFACGKLIAVCTERGSKAACDWIAVKDAVWKEEKELLGDADLGDADKVVCMSDAGYAEHGGLRAFFMGIGVSEGLSPVQVLEKWADDALEYICSEALCKLFTRIVQIHTSMTSCDSPAGLMELQNAWNSLRGSRGSWVLNQDEELIRSQRAIFPDNSLMNRVLQSDLGTRYQMVLIPPRSEAPISEVQKVYRHLGVRMLSEVGTCNVTNLVPTDRSQTTNESVIQLLTRNRRRAIFEKWYDACGYKHKERTTNMKALLVTRTEVVRSFEVQVEVYTPDVFLKATTCAEKLFWRCGGKEPPTLYVRVDPDSDGWKQIHDTCADQISSLIADDSIRAQMREAIVAVFASPELHDEDFEELPKDYERMWTDSLTNYQAGAAKGGDGKEMDMNSASSDDDAASDGKQMVESSDEEQGAVVDTHGVSSDDEGHACDADVATRSTPDVLRSEVAAATLICPMLEDDDDVGDNDRMVEDNNVEELVLNHPALPGVQASRVAIVDEPVVKASAQRRGLRQSSKRRANVEAVGARKAAKKGVGALLGEPASVSVLALEESTPRSHPGEGGHIMQSSAADPGSPSGKGQRTLPAARWGQKAEEPALHSVVVDDLNAGLAHVSSCARKRRLGSDAGLNPDGLPLGSLPDPAADSSQVRQVGGIEQQHQPQRKPDCQVNIPLEVTSTSVHVSWKLSANVEHRVEVSEVVREAERPGRRPVARVAPNITNTEAGSPAVRDAQWRIVKNAPPPGRPLGTHRCTISDLKPFTQYLLRIGFVSREVEPIGARHAVEARAVVDLAPGHAPPAMGWTSPVPFCTLMSAPVVQDMEAVRSECPSPNVLQIHVWAAADVAKVQVAISTAPLFLAFRTVSDVPLQAIDASLRGSESSPPGGITRLCKLTITPEMLGIAPAVCKWRRIHVKIRGVVQGTRLTTQQTQGEWSDLATVIVRRNELASLELHSWYSSRDCDAVFESKLAANLSEGSELQAGTRNERPIEEEEREERVEGEEGDGDPHDDDDDWLMRSPPDDAMRYPGKQIPWINKLRFSDGDFVHIPGNGARGIRCMVVRVYSSKTGGAPFLIVDRKYARQADLEYHTSDDRNELVGELLLKRVRIPLQAEMRHCHVVHRRCGDYGAKEVSTLAASRLEQFHCRFFYNNGSLEDALLLHQAHPQPPEAASTHARRTELT